MMSIYYCSACVVTEEHNGTHLKCPKCKAEMVECGFIESMESLEPIAPTIDCE